MALVSFTDSHHRFHTLSSDLVFFVVFTLRFSSINKNISLSSRLSLVFRNSFSSKISKFVKHSSFSSGEDRGPIARMQVEYFIKSNLLSPMEKES